MAHADLPTTAKHPRIHETCLQKYRRDSEPSIWSEALSTVDWDAIRNPPLINQANEARNEFSFHKVVHLWFLSSSHAPRIASSPKSQTGSTTSANSSKPQFRRLWVFCGHICQKKQYTTFIEICSELLESSRQEQTPKHDPCIWNWFS